MNPRRARTTAATACATHFLHDGLTDLLYVLFPVWAKHFALSFAQVGVLKTAFSGAMSIFQIPAGILAERGGEAWLLAGGTLVCALGFLSLGLATRFEWLLVLLLLSGLGSAVQHPLSSSLVSRAYEEGPRRVILGTYNFSGDLGKMILPAGAALLTAWFGWRWSTRVSGGLALAGAAAIAAALPRTMPMPAPEKSARSASDGGWGIRSGRTFAVLSAIHIVDSGTRTALLTFLPFLVLSKGGTVKTVGIALGVTFAGGALGKFVCGAVAERMGVIRTVIITEVGTSLGIFGLLIAPLGTALVVLPVLGVALNGTSSVLYGTVADLVSPERRSRGYGLFYTLGIGAGAVAPSVYGLLSDWAGIAPTVAAIGLMVLVTVPLCAAFQAK